MTDILGKALIKPQIIPPFHRNQIPKPMMRHLMHNSIPKTDHLLSRDRILENVQVIQSYNPCILHRSPFVLMSKNLIIFAKGVWISEIFLEKFHGFVSHLLDEWDKFHHVRIKTLYAVQIHWDVLVSIFTNVLLIGTDYKTE